MLFCTTTTAFLLPFLSSVYVFCTVRPGSKVPSCAYKACTITLRHSPRYTLVVFTGITWEEKGAYVSAFWVYIKGLPLLVSYPYSWSFPTSTGIILLTAKRCVALAFAQGMARASISTSLITLTTQPMVGLPG